MELLLDRDVRTTNSTTGKLYVDGKFHSFVLEDEDRGLKDAMSLAEIAERKIHGKTCIPEGRYPVIINHSPGFKRLLPRLLNVPGYSGVLIHPGNTAVDTEGCLLPGYARAADTVTSSRLAFDALFDILKKAFDAGEKIFITIQ